jgi:membrane fusion protein (multidrug efflux system)
MHAHPPRASTIPGDPVMTLTRWAARSGRAPLFAALGGLALMLAACGKPGGEAAKPDAGASAPKAAAAPADPSKSAVLLLAPEDLRTVGATAGGGPLVTGSIQPEKRADLRAEVAAIVTQVIKENGDAVKRGDLLLRLDDTAIRESMQSAQASERAAQQAFDQAQRQVERLKTLQAQGMTSAQAPRRANSSRRARAW